jgi:ABC-type multidrug transport system fused ATPase/permease subunit
MGILSLVSQFFDNSQHLYYLIVYFISICFSFPVESLLIPFLTGKLINELYDLTPSNRNSQIFHIIILFIIITVAWIVNAVAYSVMDYNDSRLIPEFTEYFRNFVIEKLYEKYENNFDNINIGAINTKLIILPHNLSEFLNIFMNYIFPRSFIIILIMFYFFYLDYRIGSVLMFGLLLFYFLTQYTIFQCVDLFVEHNTYFETINEVQKDKISNLSSIYSSNRMKEEIDDNADKNDKYKKNYQSSLHCTNRLKNISYFVNILLFFLINLVTISLFIYKKMHILNLINSFFNIFKIKK